jgi:hypothetical protein
MNYILLWDSSGMQINIAFQIWKSWKEESSNVNFLHRLTVVNNVTKFMVLGPEELVQWKNEESQAL